MNTFLSQKILMVLPLCLRKKRIFLHLSNFFCFMLSVRRCHGSLTKDMRPKSRVTAVFMVLGSTFKVLSCPLMLTVGSSVILSLSVKEDLVSLPVMTPTVRRSLCTSTKFFGMLNALHNPHTHFMILGISFWGVCTSKRSII